MTITAEDMDFTVFCIFEHPPARVFAAVADPDQLSQHFTMGGARGNLQQGSTVTWEFADYPGPFEVAVIEAVTDQRLVLEWGHPSGQGSNRVTFTFTEIAPGRTRVEVSETGWQPDAEDLQFAYGNVMGWTYMLAAMRVWLDHGIAIRPGMFK